MTCWYTNHCFSKWIVSVRKKNHRFFMQIIDFWVDKHRFLSWNHRFFMKIIHVSWKRTIFHASIYTGNDENVDFALKLQIWNGKPMIFVETIYIQAFVKTWFFVRKITNSSTNFRWKWTNLQHFLLHLYTGNDENDDFEWKNMNFDRKMVKPS